ncbi:MAG: DUF3788 domain-containing protein [Defluviitaleaceae bacterium]|nr:DUF3788 domain-containing protein [Defluviitaleaceae bacterium]
MDKTKPYSEVKAMLGSAHKPWEKLTEYIRVHYIMDEVWDEGNPTHKHHSNLRFRRGGKTLVTLCIRQGYFIVAVVLGKDEREKFEQQREAFSEAALQEYDAAETYHDGKWIGFNIQDDSMLGDIIKMLHVKRKPNRKTLPENHEACGRLDIGLSHDQITAQIMP